MTGEERELVTKAWAELTYAYAAFENLPEELRPNGPLSHVESAWRDLGLALGVPREELVARDGRLRYPGLPRQRRSTP